MNISNIGFSLIKKVAHTYDEPSLIYWYYKLIVHNCKGTTGLIDSALSLGKYGCTFPDEQIVHSPKGTTYLHTYAEPSLVNK